MACNLQTCEILDAKVFYSVTSRSLYQNEKYCDFIYCIFYQPLLPSGQYEILVLYA